MEGLLCLLPFHRETHEYILARLFELPNSNKSHVLAAIGHAWDDVKNDDHMAVARHALSLAEKSGSGDFMILAEIIIASPCAQTLAGDWQWLRGILPDRIKEKGTCLAALQLLLKADPRLADDVKDDILFCLGHGRGHGTLCLRCLARGSKWDAARAREFCEAVAILDISIMGLDAKLAFLQCAYDISSGLMMVRGEDGLPFDVVAWNILQMGALILDMPIGAVPVENCGLVAASIRNAISVALGIGDSPPRSGSEWPYALPIP
jgi:hypothetical protein